MSLFLNLLFETDSYSNEYLLAKFGFDTAENEPYKVRPRGRLLILSGGREAMESAYRIDAPL